jgi:RimJ/RimL family protein N-acetyltransferase
MSFVVDASGRIGVHRDIVLKTPRLMLTSWLVDDVVSLHEVHSEPETMRFVRRGRPESRLEVEQLVDRYIAQHATRGWTKWRLADLDDQLVGRAGFGGSFAGRGLSYMIRRDVWGQGLATEVAEALVLWHLTRAVRVPLRAIVAVGNDASVRVLAKVGFDEVGREDFDGTICRAFVHPSSA